MVFLSQTFSVSLPVPVSHAVLANQISLEECLLTQASRGLRCVQEVVGSGYHRCRTVAGE